MQITRSIKLKNEIKNKVTVLFFDWFCSKTKLTEKNSIIINNNGTRHELDSIGRYVKSKIMYCNIR